MVADRYRSFMRIVRILSIILAVLGVVKGWENLLFGAILILWGHNMMFSLKNQEGRLPFLLFHITFFTFLLGRPLLTILHSDGLILYEVKRYQATAESVMLALELIFLSLIGLWMGAQLSLYLEKAEKQTYEASKMKDASKNKIWETSGFDCVYSKLFM
ncbi:O-antigen polysaccharide polymerase Wzy [Oscillospiraceae bacterium NTUH-002-81]|nr:O-antigen polysaccharide polymerase Wzy [Oscillospiraceae bacterium NTUH-002-81]